MLRSETIPMLMVGLDFQSFVFPNECSFPVNPTRQLDRHSSIATARSPQLDRHSSIAIVHGTAVGPSLWNRWSESINARPVSNTKAALASAPTRLRRARTNSARQDPDHPIYFAMIGSALSPGCDCGWDTVLSNSICAVPSRAGLSELTGTKRPTGSR